MKKKKREKSLVIILFLVVIVALCVFLFYRKPKSNNDLNPGNVDNSIVLPNNDRALFSWHFDDMVAADMLHSVITDNNINVLYQHLDFTKPEYIIDFMKNNSSDVKLYNLSGAPDWDYEDIKFRLDKIVNFNNTSEDVKITGMVVDIEPYTLENWDTDSKEILAAYINSLKQAKEYANSQELELIACIPYWYDSGEYEDELEIIIKDCCDGVAVMNYYRGKELDHIETEYNFAEKYDKSIVSIFEIDKPTENRNDDIYYSDELNVIESTYGELVNKFEDLGMALHHYSNIAGSY